MTPMCLVQLHLGYSTAKDSDDGILSLRQLNSKIAMVIQIKNLMAFKAMEGLRLQPQNRGDRFVWARIIIQSRQ
jgi:hypothetical protein